MNRHPLAEWRGCGRDGAAPSGRPRRRVLRARCFAVEARFRSADPARGFQIMFCALLSVISCPRFKSALRIVSRIRAIERFIAEREIGDDISLDRNLKQWPLKPGWIAQMTARDLTRFEPQRNQHVAAETFDQRQPFAAAIGELDCDRPLRQAIEYLLDQSKTLLDLADANPDACVDVPRDENGNCEIERGVWRIAGRSPRVEIATAGASNKSCGTKSPSDRAVEYPRRSGAVLQRGRVVIKLDQPRKP